MKKTYVYWGLAILAALLVILMFFGVNFKTFSGKGKAEKNELVSSDSLKILKNKVADLTNQLTNCDDVNIVLSKQLNDCQKVKGLPVRKTAIKNRSVKATPITRTVYQEPAVNKAATPTYKRIVEPVALAKTNYTAVVNDKYAGVYSGSHGVTITDDMRLVYYISDQEFNAGEGKPTITAPRLNGKNSGKDFYFDKSKNLWIFESNTFITASRLESGNPVFWNAYIGDNSEWGYEMFIPHEVVKAKPSWAAIGAGEILQHTKDIGWDYQSVILYKIK
jgi:hypothetical protein